MHELVLLCKEYKIKGYSKKNKHELVHLINTFAQNTFTICTEENPQTDEIEFILHHLNRPCKVLNITPTFIKNGWTGRFIVETDTTLHIHILLAKGSGSFMDYIIYNQLNPDEKSSIPILLMESTKTCDSESRNTAINQRFTKFAVAKKRFPDTPLVMYYNTEQDSHSPTSRFGRRLLSTCGFRAYDVVGKDLLIDSPPFESVEEMIMEKNAFKEKKGNVSVRITQLLPHRYSISGKLSNGMNTSICHDPNIGLITGIASSIFTLDKQASFVITNHGVSLDKLKKTSDKFWYANSSYELTLEGYPHSSKDAVCPLYYWRSDTMSEKASTINFQKFYEEKGWLTAYHNHSSSARSDFIDECGNHHHVPKKITLPDVVLVDKKSKHIIICEGKIVKDCLLGVKQLDNLISFQTYVESHYKGYTLELGLCLYGNSITEIELAKRKVSYPVFFSLDSEGNYY